LVDEVRQEVAARLGAPRLHERAQVVDHRLRRRHPLLGEQRAGVDLLGPLRELRGVFERDARDAADHLHRVHRRDRGDEIGPAERRDQVEQAVDRRLDERLVPPFELRRAECLGHEVAVRAVLRAVHGEDEVAHELADVLGVDRRRERVGVAQHRFRVAVAEDLVAAALVAVHRGLLHDRAARPASALPRGVRLAVQPVDPGRLGLRLVRRGRFGHVWSPRQLPDTVVR
jgi:hypothetical protein